jgi:4-azaleucine resistance transporter AzlC
VRAEFPLLIGVFPFGMIYGVLAIKAGIPTVPAQAMSSVVFAGSAQFVTAQLVSAGTPVVVILLTIAVVNLRHALYSASLAPHVQHLSHWWKGILSYLLTDEAYAVTIMHYNQPGDSTYRHYFFLGAGLGLWSTWQVSTAVGILVGAVIPASWSLDFTLALTFIALVVTALKDRPAAAAALTAGGTALLANPLPYKLGLVLAAVVGIGVGMALEGRK